MGERKHIFPKNGREIFLREGLDTASDNTKLICPTGRRAEPGRIVFSSWPDLSRLRGRSRFGAAKARPSTSFCFKWRMKTWMPGARPGMTKDD
jgi:hypothetical protein